MLFRYTAVEGATNTPKEGSIDAVTVEVAIASLQRRGLTIVSISPAEGGGGLFEKSFSIFESVSSRDLVILSRQIATLFEAQVSALRIFQLLGADAANPLLVRALSSVADDLQAGSTIAKALAKHPKVFSDFYINMVRAGEEAGKLDQTFVFLADYLDRTYEVSSKARNALIYPAFVITTFIVVMVLMLTLVIPKISAILVESGQEIPLYTKIVIGISTFFTDYGIFLLALLIAGGFLLWRFVRTERGKAVVSSSQLSFPYVGNLYQKLYLSRIADNMHAMLSSGISMVRALEITATVVGNAVYEDILKETIEGVKAGRPISDVFAQYPEMPSILTQMVRVGEETGELGGILEKLARFYRREVTNAVDTLVNLIEPVMIVALGLGVGVLLAAVLLPIYNLSSGI